MRITTLAAATLALLAAPLSAQSINDAQIASIVVTANQVDIDAGRLAASKGSAADVKNFGQLMASDHAGVNKAAVDLATKLKVTPEDNATSRALKAAGDANVAKLNKLTGKAFDKAYIDNEVAYHQLVLDALDKTLIPGAKNEELQALLVKVRPAFVAHLEHAKKIQATLAAAAQAAAAAPRPRVHAVTIDGSRFSPQRLTLAAGDVVVWKNADVLAHTATSAAGGFDSKAIAPGASWTLKVRKAGAFDYSCTLHPTMKGSLRVR